MPYPTQQELLEWFTDGGDFLIWKKHPPRSTSYAGHPAGTKGQRYHQTKFKGVMYYTHRLLWILRNGEIPAGMLVDHRRPKERFNNKPDNLRLATNLQNQMNRSPQTCASGHKGVMKRGDKWLARMSCGGRRTIGLYDTKEEAVAALTIAREAAHGEFCRHDDL